MPCSGWKSAASFAASRYNFGRRMRKANPRHNNVSSAGRILSHGVAAVPQQMMREINLHRARLRAGAAKRGGKREMLPILQSPQMWRDHRSNRPAVHRGVGVPAHVAKNRANIQARPAPNAVQRVALFRIRQHRGAPVIQQHDVELLRPIRLARLPRAANERVVTRQRLPGAGRGQHRQKKRKVFELGQDFLDPH